LNHITLGFLASLIAGCATGIGAIPVLFFRKQHFSHRLKDLLLGFAAGVMLAATAFSLLVPAIAIGGVWIAVIGIIIGALLLDGVDKAIPHEHFEMGREGGKLEPSSYLAFCFGGYNSQLSRRYGGWS
jgi:ZIP family zinc transporter